MTQETEDRMPPIVNSKPVTLVTVTDPDTLLPVEVEIRKLESGAMLGLDGAYLQSLVDGENPNNPYEPGKVSVPDDEAPMRTPSKVEWRTEYTVVRADDADSLMKRVSRRLAEGWVLQGGMTAVSPSPLDVWFYQALQREVLHIG